jgi:DNA-binding CsgD family transcriptional regulator
MVTWQSGRKAKVPLQTLRLRRRSARLLVEVDGTPVVSPSHHGAASRVLSDNATEARTASECRRTKPPKHEVTEKTKKAAKLSLEGLSNAAIAERLGLSRTCVARLILMARDEGYGRP